MTLNEAIEHLEKDVLPNWAEGKCMECKKEHEQLLFWLKELKTRRENDSLKR